MCFTSVRRMARPLRFVPSRGVVDGNNAREVGRLHDCREMLWARPLPPLAHAFSVYRGVARATSPRGHLSAPARHVGYDSAVRLAATLGALTAALAAGGPLLAQATPAVAGLPPIVCVEAVRLARIAGEYGDAAGLRQRFEEALELPGCELPALAALLPLLRGGAYPADRAAALRDRLSGRLQDPAIELPEGMLTQLARLPAPEDGEMLLAALEKRLAGTTTPAARPAPPTLLELLDVTATLQQRLGRPAAAGDTLGRLLGLDPSEAVRWRALLLDLELGRWAAAAELLAPMVDAAEAPVVLRELYVGSLAHLGRYDDMLRQLDLLVGGVAGTRTPPDRHAELLGAAAWGLRDAGRDVEAEAIFRRALAVEPGQQEAQLALLHLYGTAEERAAQAAAVATRRAAETDPVALFEEGSDLLGAGDAESARDLLSRAAPLLDGTNYAEPAWYNLGSAQFKLERWEEAASALASAIAVNPGRTESHYKRGIALFHLDRCEEAVAALRRTLELQPDKRDAHYYLAGCYTKLGDTAAAARELALFNRP